MIELNNKNFVLTSEYMALLKKAELLIKQRDMYIKLYLEDTPIIGVETIIDICNRELDLIE
jgi:hypothetical protein